MAEYIERESAIEMIRLNYCKDCNSYNGVRCRACSFDDAMLAIEDVPKADVVEVVRCKDCEYWGGITFGNICRRWTGLNVKNCTKPTDYCSYGKRKGGEQND